MRFCHLLLIVLLTFASCQEKKPEETTQVADTQNQLKPISWLVGDWVDKDKDTEIAIETDWDKNKKFLVMKFSIHHKGKKALEGQQIIGWDPYKQKIRSWTFDSEGGFGHGTWSQRGKSWTVESSHTLPDGRLSSSINVFTPVNENSYTWESIGRQVGGEILPNIGPVTVVKRGSGS